MAADGIQNYVDMAAGLTKATKEKARAAAKTLLATAGLEDAATDATDRVAKLAEEVIAASRANRDLMSKLVATEVDKAAARLGFVRADELDDLRRELVELRMEMAHQSTHSSAHRSSHGSSPDAPSDPAAPTASATDLGLPDPPVSVDTLPEPDGVPPIEPITEPSTPPAKKAAKKAPARKAAKSPKSPAAKAAATKAAVNKVAAASDLPTVPTDAPAKDSAGETPQAQDEAAQDQAEQAGAQQAGAQQAAAKRAPAKKTVVEKVLTTETPPDADV